MLATALEAAEPRLRVLAFGDSGTGGKGQFQVAAAMEEVCKARGCDLALMLGDNFYPNGVGSVADEQWCPKFETPYEPLGIPLYAVLGNHDNSTRNGEGNNNARGDFQVDYARAHPTGWFKLPTRYYRFSAPQTPRLAEFFALDSSPLTAHEPDPAPRFEPHAYARTQTRWLKERLRKSRARWKIAFAHHPYRSNGLHRNAGTFDQSPPDKPLADGTLWQGLIEQTICAQGVDLLLASHDHDLQWLKPKPECGKTQFIVSGAAAKPRKLDAAADNPAYWQRGESLGFFWLEFTRDALHGVSYTLDAAGRPSVAFEQTLPHAD